MKKLSIEQKAKAYDEAIEKARKLATDLPNGRNDRLYHVWDLESIFPELVESEDEKIRKKIIDYFRGSVGLGVAIGGVSVKDMVSWLEKQGEQNLVNFEEAEKEKSDFVSGKFIQCRKSFNEFKEDNSYWLEYIGDDTYIGRSDNILNQKFHITPRQLYRLFSQEHCIKNNNEEKGEQL